MSVNFTCEQQNVISLLRLCPVGETQTQFFLSNFRGLESSPAFGRFVFLSFFDPTFTYGGVSHRRYAYIQTHVNIIIFGHSKTCL